MDDNTTPQVSRIRLGEVLIEQGLLCETDVKKILSEQAQTGRPFGEIAESLCNLSSEAIEEAWAFQYAHNAPTVDPVLCIPRAAACELVSARQAWQFRCMPMNREGDTLVIATTKRHIRRALKFATRVLGRPAYFVMTTEDRLCAALSEHYPLGGKHSATAGISDESVHRFMTKMRMARMRQTG